MKNLDKVQGGSRLKHPAALSAHLSRGKSNDWTGEMSIPSSWAEACEKTG